MVRLSLAPLALAALLARAAATAQETSYRIHHRLALSLLSSSSSSPALPPFTPRGEVRVHAFPATSQEQAAASRESAVLSSTGALVVPDLEGEGQEAEVDWEEVVQGGWYQVALEVPGLPEGSWPFASGRLCHLVRLGRSAPRETLTIHTTSPPTLSYTLHTPNTFTECDVSLLRSLSTASDLVSLLNDLPPVSEWNTTVRLRAPIRPDAPFLQAAKALDIDPATGMERAAPHVMAEKSFVQKNWMYIVGGFLVLSLLAGGGDDPRAAPGGGKGGGGGGKK